MSYIRTAEWRLAKSLAMKGKKHHLGHPMTEENKKALSERMLGNTYTRGLKHSEESKRKLSEAQKGITHPNKGTYIRTEEWRKHRSECMKGNKIRVGTTHTDEWKIQAKEIMLNISEAKYQEEVAKENPLYRLPSGELRPDFFEAWNKEHGIEPKEEPKVPVPTPVPVPIKKQPLIEFNRKREPNAYALSKKLNHPWAYDNQVAAKERKQ